MADNTARKSFEATARTAREATERGIEAERAEQSYSSAAEGLRDFHARLMDIAQTNTTAGLNFLAELTHAKSPTEAFELCSRHAQTQFQKLTEQSQELATLGQRIAASSSEPLRRAFDLR